MHSIIHNLKSLIVSDHSLIIMETEEEDRVEALLEQLSAETFWTFFDWSISKGMANRTLGKVLVQPNRIREAMQWMQDISVPGIFWFRDLEKHLQDPLLGRLFCEIVMEFRAVNRPMAIVLTGDCSNLILDEQIERLATFVPLDLPNEKDLELIARRTITSLKKKLEFDIDINQNHMPELIRSLQGLTANQARQKLTYSIVEDGKLCPDDIAALTHEKAQALRDGGLLEYCPVEDNQFKLGGFDNLKQWLRRASVGFTPQAAALNLRPPRGVMLVGVQGCGKSLAAKAIAKEWKFPLLKLDAGRLFDKFVGESEKNLRKALRLAESLSPCVLWIDEVEKGFSTGSGDSADGGTGKRMLGTFLTWMQENNKEVFIVATANDLDALPPEFLRKGRFDETFFVDLPSEQERQGIFAIHLQLRHQQPESFGLESLAKQSHGFSGAEIEQVVISALYESLHRQTGLSSALLLDEIAQTVPLSKSRREDIEKLRLYAHGRFVPVSSTQITNGVALSG